MPEQDQNRKIFSLLEVTRSIQKSIASTFKGQYWVKAEMNKLHYYQHSGHCYPDLVEKQDGKTVAQIRANLWKSDFLRINKIFIEVLKEPLKDGIKILFLAQVHFDPMHGMALRIIDIDPVFTLGDLEQEKMLTISRLKNEGLFAKNKSLPFPLLPSRIAIISVETSKGYADFMEVLKNNPWKYGFFHYLFPSLLQGENAVEAIISQLRRIRKCQQHFDVVAIIRGGGGDIGLSCYNNFELCKEIALFPLPVITGIGHSTNETVAEMVAAANAITPTHLAEFLIQHFHNLSVPLQKAEDRLRRAATDHLSNTQRSFKEALFSFSNSTTKALQSQRSILRESFLQLKRYSGYHLKSRLEQLNFIEKNLQNLNPENILKRGFSITLLNNELVSSIHDIKEGDQITTHLLDGHIVSTVISTKKENENE